MGLLKILCHFSNWRKRGTTNCDRITNRILKLYSKPSAPSLWHWKGGQAHPTKLKRADRIAYNLLSQNFNPVAADEVWAVDITYLNTAEGWMYLAIYFRGGFLAGKSTGG